MTRFFRRLALGVAACCATVPPLTAQPAPMAGAAVKDVGIVTLETTSVPYSVTLPGRAVAYAQTDIRPRVAGMVEDIVYQPGRQVAAGDLLYRLEAETYETAVAAARAEQAGAEAAVATAQATVDRYARLEGTGVTTSDLQTAQSTLAQAKATLASANAALEAAQLDLDRVEIRSPIAGTVDVSAVSVGTLVTANQTDALTTVTTMDPIYVDVEESSARMMRVRSRINAGEMKPGDTLAAVLTLENGETYRSTGELITPGSQVSTTTGSVDLRFQFENADRLIMPGQFLRVELVLGHQQAILVPQRAAERQADGTLTVFLARDGVAHQVTLTYSGTYQNGWITTDGVEPGDKVIVDGLNNLADGMAINPVAVTINADGVVTEDSAQSE